MAEHAHHADIPAMDYREHERTYAGFLLLAEVVTVASLAIVAALAVGGAKHAWGTALFGTLIAVIGAVVGIAAPSISWRAPAVSLVLMLLALVLL
ncbi:aa3-type cytochrome c oxidase subunit IV [Bosea sp. (in: a-proteobacteria)]|uniref:aa3-type cytochrome c oxidase subunit IV n=1 Tax=Bosea sp. (in: a-proteobacteria) TaxID=1871050 RepID=UPI002608FAD4|nr:aa3-type cytochrome c oxidase subunit IV [Bosea sp. (in: a-proteobacteria)]MCO5091473.1 aa3-type cytochrome c oxidase subunit IV [Bosea sp. (in: a-proteobacteria)]